MPARKQARPRGASLSWEPTSYNPQGLQAYSERDLRREYTRLRDVARKRIQRLQASEFKGSSVARYNTMDKYRKLSEIRSPEELRRRLSDLARFVTAKTGSVKGLREQRTAQLETLHEHGFTFVDKTNLKEWGQYLQWLKARYPNRYAESVSELGQGWNIFRTLRNSELTAKQVQRAFGRWMESERPGKIYWEPSAAPVPEEFVRDGNRRR